MNKRFLPQTRKTRNPGGFTLVEIMIVVAIIGILLAIAVPTWMKQRAQARLRVCQENLSKIDSAKENWAMEQNKTGADIPVWTELVSADGSGYLKKEPVCPGQGAYELNAVNQYASCSIVAPLDHNDKP